MAKQPEYITAVLELASERLKDLAQNNIEANGSVITGHLKNDSMTYEIRKIAGGQVSVFSVVVLAADGKTNYAYFVEYGRGPVFPKDGGVLRFQDRDGNWISSKGVAAAPAKPFFRPALNKVSEEIVPIGEALLSKYS